MANFKLAADGQSIPHVIELNDVYDVAELDLGYIINEEQAKQVLINICAKYPDTTNVDSNVIAVEVKGVVNA